MSDAMKRIRLADLLTGDAPEPERICDGLLYRGAVHVLAGAPEAGKTTLGLAWCLQVIRGGGTAVMLDKEGGRRVTGRRLRALGMTPQEEENFAYIPAPDWTGDQWEKTGKHELIQMLREYEPRIILIDSAAAVLAAAGLDENSAGDVMKLWVTLTGMSRGRCQPAIVIIDHLSKASDASGDRYSRGSSAKLAQTDVLYRLEAKKAFSKSQDGALKLAVTKDREGCLDRFRRIRVTTSGAIAFSFEDGWDDDEPDRSQMSPASRKLLEALDSQPRTIQDLTGRIAARHGHGLKRETASRELSALARAGYAIRTDQGAGRSALWSAGEPSGGCDQSRDDHEGVPVTDPYRKVTGNGHRSQVGEPSRVPAENLEDLLDYKMEEEP